MAYRGVLWDMDGTVLDMMVVYDELYRFIQKIEYDVRCVGYNRYNAK